MAVGSRLKWQGKDWKTCCAAKLINPSAERRVQIHRSRIYGEYNISGVSYRYDPNSPEPVLAVKQLTIKKGEKIAILGRNGSEKSTLLQMLAGLLQPNEGALLLDGDRLSSIDPLDVRRDVGLLGQTSTLFFGAVCENLRLGMPLATEEDMFQALDISRAINFIQQLPEGMDYQLQEGVKGLSGGQRQQLLLARAIFCASRVYCCWMMTSRST